MANDLQETPEYRHTMGKLEEAKHLTQDGQEFWYAREICPILGYQHWPNFVSVIDKAKTALLNNGVDPSHHVVDTNSMMGVGKGGQRAAEDFFLSRPACYLIAMNGESSKPEIAASQAYFVIRTRQDELAEQEEKRLALRDKVTASFKRVSGTAKQAGLPNHLQGVFHDARYQGLYKMSAKDVQMRKGLKDGEKLFDRAGPLELSANDFQMNLAADVISRENIKGSTCHQKK